MISFVIPVYNEGTTARGIIKEIAAVMAGQAREYEIIVVDDGSTRDIPADNDFPQCRILRHPANRGTGAARTTGVLAARGEFILMIDADGTYSCADIPKLLERMETADMVVGARSDDFGELRRLRIAVKFLLRKFAGMLAGSEIDDLNSGLRLMRKDVLVRYLSLLPDTHSWVTTITMSMLYNGNRVVYVPVSYSKRIGRSTFHPVTDTFNLCKALARTTWAFRLARGGGHGA